MKKTISVLLFGALLLTACATNERLPEDLSGLTCSTPVYVVSHDFANVEVSFEITVPANYFERRVTFTILPEIEFANGDVKKLPCKSVQGTSVIETNYPFVDWSEDQVISYRTTVPFCQGLATAVLDINGRIYNCLSKADHIKDIAEYEMNIPMPLVCPPMPKSIAMAEGEAITSIKGKIYFPVNKYTVTKETMKQPEITRTLNLVKDFIDNTDFTISNIEIRGNASPEGTSRINNPLAEKRAAATKAMMEKELKNLGYNKPLNDNQWTVLSTENMGFWDEFYTLIKESEIENKDAIADKYLSLHSDPVEAEKQIRKDIATNKDVKNLMMPALRYGAIAINYERMPLTAAQVAAIAGTNAEILSPNEVISAAEAGCPHTAIELYQKSITKNPGSWELYINLASAYIKVGEYDKAEAVLKDAAKVAPNMDYVNLQYAYMNIKKEDYAKAKEYLDKVNGAQSDYYKGIVAMYEGRWEDAVEYLKAQPDINLAIAQLNANDVKGAKKTLEGLCQDCPYVKYYTGVVYARLNEKGKAKEYKEEAFKADPCIVVTCGPKPCEKGKPMHKCAKPEGKCHN